MGLAKKVLLADTLAPIVDGGINNLDTDGSINIALVMACYVLQLYFDFSGYSDMALGIGQMFRLELPVNFDSPYKASTMGEYWSRWHKTMTAFFTRYVYIPLGGSRKGLCKTLINTLLVFALSGFWHGANWTFFWWGVMNGVCICLHRLLVKHPESCSRSKVILSKASTTGWRSRLWRGLARAD